MVGLDLDAVHGLELVHWTVEGGLNVDVLDLAVYGFELVDRTVIGLNLMVGADLMIAINLMSRVH